ncbi:MAG: hypothetical protein JWM38_1868 [Sphingomonas bacterium]|nr:hypothetical protein [Sphingomonas bacterium]MDB5718441.1 hypothetical protein [Sphingomonas bacterium]
MNRFLAMLLAAASLVTLYFALWPTPPSLLQSDKSQHELAFAVLTLLASLAFPAARQVTLLLALGAFGALIELLQLFPALHRQSDVMDWVADMAAIAVTLLLVTIVRAAIRQRAKA